MSPRSRGEGGSKHEQLPPAPRPTRTGELGRRGGLEMGLRVRGSIHVELAKLKSRVIAG